MLLIAYLLGILAARKSEDQKRRGGQYTSDRCQGQPMRDNPISVVCIPPILSDEENRKKKRNNRHETITFWVQIATLVVFVTYAGFTILIWRANKKAAEAAKQSADAAIAAQRPWLKLELRMAEPLTMIPSGYDFAVIPSVTNIGNSVAKDVSFRFDHRVSGMSPNDNLFKLAATYRDWCEDLKPNVAGLDTYFPHEAGESPGAHVNVLMDEMQKYRLPPKNEPRFILLLFGCLAYRFDGSPSLHHTAVVYELTARQNNLPYMLKTNTTYSISDLIFEHFPWDWEHAD